MANLTFDVGVGASRSARELDEGTPLHLLVLGAFSGGTVEDLHPVSIGVDNFDAVMRRLIPEVTLDLSAQGMGKVTLAFEDIDHFHPDSLYRRLDVVAELRESRARLKDPARFEAETARLLSDATEDSTGQASAPAPSSDDDDNVFSRLLGQEVGSGATAARSTVDRMVANLVTPHIQPGMGAEQDALVASIDQAIAEYIRAVLHAPAFQALEALWRAVHWLVYENPADEIAVTLADVSRDRLLTDFGATGGDITQSMMFRKLVTENQGPGARAYHAVIADLTFSASAEDIALLADLGLVAGAAGAPLLAGAAPGLYGAGDVSRQDNFDAWAPLDGDNAARWESLRQSELAPWIGLAAPRMIGRLPYGRGTDEIERFDFTELLPNAEHETFLWMNGAFACAQLLAAAYAASGWNFTPGDALDVMDLPLALYEAHGGQAIKPCAEVNLSERGAAALAGLGIMGLLSHRDRNAVRVAGFRSIAEPPTMLAGVWSG